MCFIGTMWSPPKTRARAREVADATKGRAEVEQNLQGAQLMSRNCLNDTSVGTAPLRTSPDPG